MATPRRRYHKGWHSVPVRNSVPHAFPYQMPSFAPNLLKKCQDYTPFLSGLAHRVSQQPLLCPRLWQNMLGESGPRSSWWWKFEIWGVQNVVDFWWQIFCRISLGKIGFKFVTENFTTFFTARKEFVTWNSLWEHPRLKYAWHRHDVASPSCDTPYASWGPMFGHFLGAPREPDNWSHKGNQPLPC